eukprot:622327-Rhodomonas_salina.1
MKEYWIRIIDAAMDDCHFEPGSLINPSRRSCVPGYPVPGYPGYPCYRAVPLYYPGCTPLRGGRGGNSLSAMAFELLRVGMDRYFREQCKWCGCLVQADNGY